MKTNRWTAAALLVASVLLHVAVLMVLLDMLAPRREKETAAKTMELVWAVPVKPPAIAEPAPPPVKRRPLVARRTRAPAAATARVADRENEAPPAAAEAPRPARSEPVFDRQAALVAARKLAGEKDMGRPGSVGGEIAARRPPQETRDEKLGREIASGKRSDCLGPNANGNLLSPLFWLLDKKGNGCKM